MKLEAWTVPEGLAVAGVGKPTEEGEVQFIELYFGCETWAKEETYMDQILTMCYGFTLRMKIMA